MATVRFEQDGGFGVLVLENPPLNLIGEALIDDLVAGLQEIEASDGLRAMLVRAEGDVFSAGADVRLFAGKAAAVKVAVAGEAEIRRTTGIRRTSWALPLSCPPPVIAR